ncbi:MAG: hypothetical protein AAGG38_14415 [Planctomycetota bacterium]
MNPSFPLTAADARADEARMRASPLELSRPVVVLAGWADPFFANTYWTGLLRRQGVPAEQMLGLSFWDCWGFESCREKVVESVEARWPSGDGEWTTEVDVVAFSMGGLVARYAAAAPWDRGKGGAGPEKLGETASTKGGAGEGKRLRIRRLFTISTPHRGAKLAWVPTLDGRVRDMRPGSALLGYLDGALAEAEYELTVYARLGDGIVGTENTSPAGVTPWWVAVRWDFRSHQEAYRDPRIRADILRRLRGEVPWTQGPAVGWEEAGF